MSEAMGSSTSGIETVYVRLLDEGTTVYRPAAARMVSNSTAELLKPNDYDDAVEAWEFAPGTAVVVEERELQGEIVRVAVRVFYDGHR